MKKKTEKTRSALLLPHRRVDRQRREHRGARRAGRASNRGQPAPAHGVTGRPRNALYEGNLVRAMLVAAAPTSRGENVDI